MASNQNIKNAAKTALISGGTSGIGKATVIKLLAEGYFVSTFSTDKPNVKSLHKEISEEYGKDCIIVLQANVSDEIQMENVVAKTIAKFGKIDILINNAGFGYFSEADKVDIKRYKAMVQTNLIGMATLTKEVLPYMKKQKRGHIVNIASVSGKRAYAEGEFYSSTKFGVMGYSEGLRNELRKYGIKVSTVCPGMTKTGFFTKEELARRKKTWPGGLPSMMNAEDIANAIAFICNQPANVEIEDILIMPFDEV